MATVSSRSPEPALLLAALEGQPLPILQEFADDEHLPSRQEPERQLAVIARALGEKEETAEHLADFLAVAELDKFYRKLPPTARFCALKALGQGNLDLMRTAIRRALYRREFPLRDLVDYLDGLRESGRQHIFLYRLHRGNRRYLRQLRDPIYVRGLLSEDQHECFTTPALRDAAPAEGAALTEFRDHEAARFLWAAGVPELAMVSQRENRTLVIKFVETRMTGARSVNFFFLDLETGDAEIRVQWIERGGQKELARSIASYRQLVGQLIELGRFDPLMLEPANRRLLKSPRYRKISYRIEQPGKQAVSGKGGGSAFLTALMMAFKRYFAAFIDTEIETRDGHTFRVQLYGKTNELRVKRECSASQLSELQTSVRRLGAWARPETPPGGGEAPIEPGTVTRYLERYGQDRLSLIKLKAMAKSMHVAPAKLVLYLEQGAPGSGSLADAAFFIRCPKYKRAVADDHGVSEYPRLAQVPETLACPHEGGGIVDHKAEGNIWVRFPNLGTAPIDWKPIGVLLALIFVTTAGYVWILNLVGGGLEQGAVTAAYLLTLVVETIVVRKVVGPDQFDEAVKDIMGFVGAKGKLVEMVKDGTSKLGRKVFGKRRKGARRKGP